MRPGVRQIEAGVVRYAMPSPFPGMDPYLEDCDLWPDVHARLITAAAAALTPLIRPKFLARVEQRTFSFKLDDPADDLYLVPDIRVVYRTREGGPQPPFDTGEGGTAVLEGVEVTEELLQVGVQRYIDVIDAASREIVTVIEIVSPSNKLSGGAGQRAFERKREQVQASETGWVEIDLLRGRRSMPVPNRIPETAYMAFTDRFDPTTKFGRRQHLFPIDLRRPLPTLPIPLRPDDVPVPLNLQAVLDRIYDEAAYDGSADYAADPPPPGLSEGDAAWLDALLREKRLRP